MSEKSAPSASGLQIAFLTCALLLLAAPADKYLFSQWTWARAHELPVSRFALFAVAAAILFGIRRLRRICLDLLAAPIPRERKPELAAALVLNVACAFAGVGAVMLGIWLAGGDPALARRIGEEAKAAEQMRYALSAGGILTFIFLGGLVGPVIEELVFRGMIYRAWESRWGWVPAALASSLLFALLHPNRFSQFFASLIHVCLLRRTGSLRAAIVVHGAFNTLMWYPLVGRFVFPSAARGTGELSDLSVNLACLAAVCVALPIYLWMSRDANARRAPRPAG